MRLSFAALAACCIALPVRAQEPLYDEAAVSPDSADLAAPARGLASRRPDQLLVAASAAGRSPQAGWLGDTPGRSVFIASVRSVWHVRQTSRALISYFADVVPLAIVTDNPTALLSPNDCKGVHPGLGQNRPVRETEYQDTCATEVRDAYGVGIVPVGLSAHIARVGGMNVVAEGSLGAIMFNRRMPYPNAARLNFDIAGGIGVEIPVARSGLVRLGYRLHHLSNAWRGDFNPGVAAHAISVGWGRRMADTQSGAAR